MKYFAFCIVAALLLCTVSAEEKARFDNYRVYSLSVENEEQLNILREIDNAQSNSGYEFWRGPTIVGRNVDIMVAPHLLGEFSALLSEYKIESTVITRNVQEMIDNEQPKIQPRVFGWTSYQTLDEIYAFLDTLLETYPTILTNINLGNSFENRPIRAVRLSHQAGNPTVFIESNIHAREWITSATATWFLNELLTSTAEDVRNLATTIDWVIVPVLNVDGFDYSHRVNRLWRKTRQPHAHLCYGTDGNRNFGFEWMRIGASTNPCSDTFGGPVAWSEPDSVHLAEYVTSIADSIKIFLSFHSYGQYLLFPYGHTNDPSPNYDVLMAVAERTRNAIGVRYGTQYTVGQSSTTLYPTSGSSVDWAYGVENISLAYTLEMRANGTYGFVLPADQILPNALEVLDGILALVDEARALGQL